jgi:protein with PEP-CTERM/exosortase system signal
MKIRSLLFACVLHKLERSITPLTTRLFASFLAVSALLVLAPANASAVPLTYQVGTGSSVALYTEAPGAPNFAQTGLGLAYSPLVTTPFSFTLNDNGIQDFDETGIDEFSFDFFKIWTTEEIAEADEFTHKNITATLDLTTLGQPLITGSPPLNGTFLDGTNIGINQARWQGNAVWDNPAPSFVAPDRTFIVDLSNVTFNATVGDTRGGPVVNGGEEGAAVVRATITQTASSVPSVPDTGSTAALLGLGLLAMACARKRLPPTVKCPSIN